MGRTLHGRTLGFYGYGRIACEVSRYARALGKKVMWWGSDEGRARAAAAGETVASSRAAFFAEADMVSFHQRLDPATQGTITPDDLARCGPTRCWSTPLAPR